MPQPGLAQWSSSPSGETGVSAFDEQKQAISDGDANGKIERCCDDLWYRDCSVGDIETGCEQLPQLTALVGPSPRHVIVPTARIHEIICVKGEHDTKESVIHESLLIGVERFPIRIFEVHIGAVYRAAHANTPIAVWVWGAAHRLGDRRRSSMGFRFKKSAGARVNVLDDRDWAEIIAPSFAPVEQADEQRKAENEREDP